jgi:acetyl/propionyl-CoA carboxylase alpha subunit
VASGEPLPKKQEELSINGWAVEAWLYAEDPVKGFLPSSDRVDRRLLDHRAPVETGVEEGDLFGRVCSDFVSTRRPKAGSIFSWMVAMWWQR